MGRLIDADELIKQGWRLERHGQSNELVGVMSIADVPTAFDIEAIVKELDDLKFSYFFTLANTGEAVNDFAYKNVGNAMDKAIEIVKGGVK